MEEAKAAAYYDELTRKGGAAARFKQGLGFSAASDPGDPPVRGSALVSSSSSFLGGFVRASSPSKASELEKQSRLESVQNKLRKKKERKPSPLTEEERRDARVSRRRSRSRSRSREREEERDRERRSRRRSRSRSWSREREEERERERRSRRRSRSRERYRDGDRDRDSRRRRSRSRSDSDGDRRRRERRRNRSSSPRDRRAEKRDRSPSSQQRERKPLEKRNGGADYSRLIEGYEKMSQAERVRAKMKLQLAETVEKDETKGSSGWERFEFNKDAPLDEEEVQAAEDDKAIVKHIGQSFRFSAVQEKREQKIRDAHDEAMFGVPAFPPAVITVDEVEFETVAEPKTEDETLKELNGSDVAASLLSEKVLAKQQGSWRDRARKQGN